MHTARLLTVSRSILGWGCLPRGVSAQGGWVSQHAMGQTPPWTEWQTSVKTLPCPKLRLRAVNIGKLILIARRSRQLSLELTWYTPHVLTPRRSKVSWYKVRGEVHHPKRATRWMELNASLVNIPDKTLISKFYENMEYLDSYYLGGILTCTT